MQGRIWVESSIGSGSRFQFTAQLGIAGRVRFLGWQNDAAPYFAAADLYVCDRQSQCESLGELHHALGDIQPYVLRPGVAAQQFAAQHEHQLPRAPPARHVRSEPRVGRPIVQCG